MESDKLASAGALSLRYPSFQGLLLGFRHEYLSLSRLFARGAVPPEEGNAACGRALNGYRARVLELIERLVGCGEAEPAIVQLSYCLGVIDYIPALLPGGDAALQTHFAHWAEQNSPFARQLDTVVADVLNADDVYKHELFWNAVFGCVCLGKKDKALMLLGNLPDNVRYGKMTVQLVSEMPLLEQFTTQEQFVARWEQWRASVEKFVPEHNKALAAFFSALAGNVADIDAYNDMLEMRLLARLLFVKPICTAWEFYQMALGVIDEIVKTRELSFFEMICGGLVCGDLQTVFESMHAKFGSWICFHIADILLRVMPTPFLSKNPQTDVDIVVQWALNYCTAICENPALFRVALEYLETFKGYMSDDALAAMVVAVVKEVPLQSDRDAERIIDTCKKYDFAQKAVTVLAERMGNELMQRGEASNAFDWFVMTENPVYIMQRALPALQKGFETGDFREFDELSSRFTGPDGVELLERVKKQSEVAHTQLLFMVNYKFMREKLAERKYAEYMQCVIDVVSDPKVPPTMKLRVVEETLKQLPSGNFKASDVTNLLVAFNTAIRNPEFVRMTQMTPERIYEISFALQQATMMPF